MKRDALAIFHAALAAADPYASALKSLKQLKLPLQNFDRIFLVAVGKAASGMASAVEKVVGNRLTEGIALTKYQHTKHDLRHTKIYEAAHPVPDAAGFAASQKIEQLLRTLNARDLLITAISGGASALLFAPIAGLSLKDKQRCTHQLLHAGADIFELNAVRKHLSRLKGGRMAALAYPATVVSLLLSDVIGDPMDVIGSGPTAPDTSTVEDARNVLTKYNLPRYLAHISEETPKPSDPLFQNVRNVITASNHQALTAAAAQAKILGYRPLILSSSIQGEAREVGRVLAAILRDAQPNSCILSGGETTVTVKGKGKGGPKSGVSPRARSRYSRHPKHRRSLRRNRRHGRSHRRNRSLRNWRNRHRPSQSNRISKRQQLLRILQSARCTRKNWPDWDERYGY